MPIAELRKHYPDLEVPFFVDTIDDGETLQTFSDSSQDFIIANHFLEHCEDPIGTLQSFSRVLRPGGTLYMAVPDKRFTFDHTREVTALQHLIDDHLLGSERSREEHYEEWTRHICNINDDQACKTRCEQLMQMRYSIHFHVWTEKEFLEFLQHISKVTPLEIRWTLQDGNEILCILQKR
jgi:predicted SAM-dependent methyltransferase